MILNKYDDTRFDLTSSADLCRRAASFVASTVKGIGSVSVWEE